RTQLSDERIDDGSFAGGFPGEFGQLRTSRAIVRWTLLGRCGAERPLRKAAANWNARNLAAFRWPGLARACHCDTRASQKRAARAPAGRLAGEGREEPGGGDRDLANAGAEVGDRVLDRVRDGGGAGDGAALANALDAERVDSGRMLVERDRERGQLVGLRDCV